MDSILNCEQFSMILPTSLIKVTKTTKAPSPKVCSAASLAAATTLCAKGSAIDVREASEPPPPVIFAILGNCILKDISGSLVWVSVIASLGGVLISWLVGIKLPGLEYNNQVVEAAFRKELVYAEDDRVEYAKPPTIFELFVGIKFNYHRLFLHYGYFDLWLIMYNQSMIIVPYVLMGPGLFTGAMTLGILIQTSSAFREVQGSFSLFMQNWTRITELRSIFKRLNEFEKNIGFKTPNRLDPDIVRS